MEFLFNAKEYTDDKGTLVPAQQVKVPVERWAWGVIYKDGSELHQFSEEKEHGGVGVFHQIGEVVQENLLLFILYKPDDRSKRIDLVVPKGAKIIHKYRNYIFDANTPAEKRVRVYMFGYKLGDHHHYNFILPDDRIVQSNTDNLALTEFKI